MLSDSSRSSYFVLCVGPLAQLVEQLTLNQRVRSSSLRRPTIFFKHLRALSVKSHLVYKLLCPSSGRVHG